MVNKKEKNNKIDRLTIRFDPYTMLKMSEMIDKLKQLHPELKISYGQLIRSILNDFFIKNEETINNIIDKK